MLACNQHVTMSLDHYCLRTYFTLNKHFQFGTDNISEELAPIFRSAVITCSMQPGRKTFFVGVTYCKQSVLTETGRYP